MRDSIRNFDLYWQSSALSPAIISKRPRVPAYRVGEPLRVGRCSWPIGSHYNYSENGHELVLIRSSIDDGAILDVRRGEAEFAITTHPSMILFAYRFGRSIPWSDAPYSWHMRADASRLVPPVDTSPEARALLWVSLVGAEDGMIHAQRGLVLAPAFTRTLEAAIRRQALGPFDPHGCVAAVQDVLVRVPSPQDRLRLATSRTLGNC
ncbi:hypothetical protein [Aquisphaera insulae]|uniref:hypothetical protein n=1 Tax=Aquisphaera insulae TaxID=2712864 RepID=UPI0013EC9631|nr:hypothetical protein [Aquisphaera insulae]